MISPSTLTFALLFSKLVFAANDWSTPCLSGECSYDLNNSTADGTARGSLYIVSCLCLLRSDLFMSLF